MKNSKLQRKYVNAMRQMADVPWPARRFKYPPTFGTLSRQVPVGQCDRKVGEAEVKHGRLKRKRTVSVPCGGQLIAKLSRNGKRRVYCESCRTRRKERQLAHRFEQRARRFGTLAPKEQIREERRTARMFSRLKRGNR